MNLVLVLLTHHIEMTLKGNAASMSASFRRWLFHNDVSKLIRFGRKAEPFGVVQDVFGHSSFVLRAPRDPSDLREVPPHGFGLQACNLV